MAAAVRHPLRVSHHVSTCAATAKANRIFPSYQGNPETRSHDRYVIDRVTAQSHSLTLRDAQGETQVVRISSLDSSWSLFRPEKMPVADGERLRVTGKIPGLRVSGGDRLQVASVSEDAMTVVVPGRAEGKSMRR